MRKAIKIVSIIILSLAIVIFVLIGTFYIITADAKLDESKLVNYSQSVEIFDGDGNKIESASLSDKRKSVYVKDLSDTTIHAFIASEDREFYRHNGLNYKRMLKALYTNITSFSFKEGASTISQQLIKNTHLSNDKTISRKLKEIRLTKQLEKRYSKDEILEMYLNTIYFGHNCYGLQSAANFYFNTKAEDLTLCESATLVGLLTSPNNYSPFKHPERSLERRNTVLKGMLDCDYISQEQYDKAVAAPLGAQMPQNSQRFGDYISAVFDELEEYLPDCDISKCKIYTYLNRDMQNFVENLECDYDSAVFISNNEHGVEVYTSSIGTAARQPGSTVKPLLVYAPAIQEKLVHPFTLIDDEKIDFSGYRPENYDKKYHGKVSVKECLTQSYNVPAVKTLNALTLQKAENYANLLNFELQNEDKTLALALGGMKYGLTLKEICDGYTVFSHAGNFAPSHFIKRVTDENGKELYMAENHYKTVFSQGTASLMNDILIETSKTGTAKKLKNLPFDVASKTGTCGDSQGNTDGYAISYTQDATFGVWAGSKDYGKTSITGGGVCCNVMKEILAQYYENRQPPRLDTQSGTTEISIDRYEYTQNMKIMLADEVAPNQCKYRVKCLSDHIPKEVSTRFSKPTIVKPEIHVQTDAVSIYLCQTEYYSYLIKCDKTTIYNGKWQNEIKDIPTKGTHVYSVTPFYDDGKNKFYGEEICLGQVIVGDGSNDSPPGIVYRDWYNQ